MIKAERRKAEWIMGEVCDQMGIEVHEMWGAGRHPRVVAARWIVWSLVRRFTRLSFPDIAAVTLLRAAAHASVQNGCWCFNQRMGTDGVLMDCNRSRVDDAGAVIGRVVAKLGLGAVSAA